MGAKANRSYIASVKESEWGVTPATPAMQKLNFTAETKNYALETTTPDTIRDDRMTSDVINVSAGNEGGYEFEMQALASGPEDFHLMAALWAVTWQGTNTGSLDLENAVIAAAGKTIDFTGVAGGDPGLVVDQKVAISGSGAGNDGVYTVTNAGAAPVYTFAETFTADETLPAASVFAGSTWIKNGITEHSFSLERGLTDVGEYFLYTGMVVNEFNLAFEAGAVVTGDYTFVGKTTQVAQAPFGGSYVDPPTTPFMSAGFNIQNVMIDGAPIQACLLQSVELGINNNVEGKSAVGAFEYCDVAEGEFELTGAISLYFNDSSFYQRFVSSTAFSLSFQMVDNDGNYYIVTLPKLKLSADVVNVEGKNTDVMDAAEYTALYDETEGCMIRIDRIIA